MINLSNIVIPGLKDAIHNGSFHITTVTGTLEDHALLSNLDYASAGHTGFASEALVATTSGYLNTRIDNIVVGSVSHNNTLGLQGGTTDEYYHLTAAEYTELQAGYVSDSEMTTISGDIVAQIPSLAGYATESYVDTASGTLQSQITTNANDIASNAASIAVISGTADTNTTNIGYNTASIAVISGTADQNTADIAVVSGSLDSHTSNLAIHREINDGGLATTDLWSGYQIHQEIIDNIGSTNTIYYLHNSASDIGGYEDLLDTPGTGGTDSDSVVVDSGAGETLIGSYATTSGSPNTTAIPAGTWTMTLYADVSATAGGPHYIRAKWYKRVGASEYYLFEQEASIDSATIKKFTVDTTVSGILLNATDRLVVKMYGETASPAARTLTFYYEGTDTSTRWNTPVVSQAYVDHGELIGLADDDHPQYVLVDGTRNITGQLTLESNLIIQGNLVVSGTEFITETETVKIEDNLLLINYGEVGAGVTTGSGGIEVARGSETNYQFLFDEATDTFRVGERGDLQAVATREDAPTDTYVPYWDAATVQFKTAGSLAYSDIATETYADNAASGAVSTHESNYDHNQIAYNQASIAIVSGTADANTTNISYNTASIALISGTVDTNAINIGHNTASIALVSGTVDANTTNIGYNTASIAVVSGTADTNATNISYNTASIAVVSGTVDTHIGNTSNPHSVTAAQLSALQNVVEDTTPQLGGDLDANGNAIVAADHGTATDGEVVNVIYGTGAAPTPASNYTIGTIYIKYTA